MCEQYQGFSNRPTWCASLWLTNEEPLYRELVARVNSADDTRELEDNLREWLEELAEPTVSEPTMAADMLTWALAIVDYRELAETYWADFRETATAPV